MSDREFQLGGRSFKLCKIDALRQFHIVRRMGPILSDLMPALAGAKKLMTNPNISEDEKIGEVAKIAAPLMNGISKLSDADSEFVLYGLLGAVEMQQAAGNWARVASGSMLMIQDLELPALMQLAGRAFAFNLSGFFTALPRQS